MSYLYEISNLKKIFGSRIILDLDHLDIEKGKITTLLGPNGAGKTTLLEILAFLSQPSSGNLRFKEKDINYNGHSLPHFRQGVVLLQQNPIMFSTSVFNNVVFPLKIRKKAKEGRKTIVRGLLERVGMEEFRDARAETLSGGETQRVAIAQALACYPDVILLDEPTASVDVENQILIERIIKDINKEKGISVIFTTHDMNQAARIANETVFLYDGKVAQSIHENIFSGYIETNGNGNKYCILNDDLKLRVNSDRTGNVRISIKADQVSIGPSFENHVKENTFHGRILQLTHEQNCVRALIDIGVPISALISVAAFDTIPMIPGREIWIAFPPESIEFFY